MEFKAHEIEDQIKINYKYSFGGQSRYFLELKNHKKIYGTKCIKCGYVWSPPRINCSKCYAPTEWIPLKDTGTIMVSTIVWYGTSEFLVSIPYGVGYIKIDGADTSMLQEIFSENLVPSKIKKGKKVRAVFLKERKGKATDFFFVPVEEYDSWIKKPEYEGGSE